MRCLKSESIRPLKGVSFLEICAFRSPHLNFSVHIGVGTASIHTAEKGLRLPTPIEKKAKSTRSCKNYYYLLRFWGWLLKLRRFLIELFKSRLKRPWMKLQSLSDTNVIIPTWQTSKAHLICINNYIKLTIHSTKRKTNQTVFTRRPKPHAVHTMSD